MKSVPTAGRRVVMLFSVAALLAGCGPNDSHPLKPPPAQASDATKASASVSSSAIGEPSLESFRAKLVKAQKDIDGILTSVNDLTSPSQQNLQSAFNTYTD